MLLWSLIIQDWHCNIFILKVCFEIFMLYKLYLYENCCVHCLTVACHFTCGEHCLCYFQVCELHVAGYKFSVLNNAFLIHRGLKTAMSFHQTKDLDQERNRLLFRQFKIELREKYPESSRRCYWYMCCGLSCLGHMRMLKCPIQNDLVNRISVLPLYYTLTGLISMYV